MGDSREAKLQAGDFDHIPIIDLSTLNSSHLDERKKLAQHIYHACTQVGFFYIINHGIPEDLITASHTAAHEFFSLTEEQKMKYYMGKSTKYRGFTPFYAEKSTGTYSDNLAEKTLAGTLSEAFNIGYEIGGDSQRSVDDMLPPDIYGLYGDNQWPGDDILPGFRETFLQWFAQGLNLCRALMRIFALAVGEEEHFFDSKMKYPGAQSRMMHYPPQPVVGEVQEGVGSHTDYGCLTILSQDSVPALEVLNRRGEWVVAPPIPGTLVVNIADCLAIWTNEMFRSTSHRVTNLTGKERYSIPFFFSVDPDITVSVLESCLSDEKPACREPFKAGEFIRQRMSKAYTRYGQDPPAKPVH